jgi:hypothetical protein
MSELNPTPEFEEKVRKATAVPDANPEFVHKLQKELAGRPVRMKPHFRMKPAWAFAFAILLLTVIASAPMAVSALKRLLGYIPEVGVVENTGNVRMLAEPASVTRDGVTITITQAMVYADHVELTYSVQGIAESYDTGNDMCGYVHPNNDFWSDADADLRLPDGTIVRRDYAGTYQSANAFAMKPVYAVAVPSDVTELTMVLRCIPFTRLGDAPENWEVPFKLVAIPDGTVIGEPVIVVEPTVVLPVMEPTEVASSVPAPVVTMTLSKIVPLDTATLVYFSMDVENGDPSLISIMPADAYLIDSQGQKIDLIGGYTWQPFEHRVGSEFEFRSETKPANGPFTVVVEKAVAYYAPLYTEPQQATPDEMSFTFDVGENPQYGQTWQIDRTIEIAGYPVHILSARAASFADIQTPEFIDGSQGYDYGYEFIVETDPSAKLLLWMDIMSESANCWLSNQNMNVPESSSINFTMLCKDGYPKGNVRVTIGELSILVDNTWQATWTP